MQTTNLKQLELTEFTGTVNRKQHCRAAFPMLGAHGTRNLATVYFEIEPGDELGTHTDSAEEILVILEGEAEVHIGNKKIQATAGTLALVPEKEKHNLVNTGSSVLKVLGVFGGANHIVAIFNEAWLPVHSNIVDTAHLFAAESA